MEGIEDLTKLTVCQFTPSESAFETPSQRGLTTAATGGLGVTADRVRSWYPVASEMK